MFEFSQSNGLLSSKLLKLLRTNWYEKVHVSAVMSLGYYLQLKAIMKIWFLEGFLSVCVSHNVLSAETICDQTWCISTRWKWIVGLLKKKKLGPGDKDDLNPYIMFVGLHLMNCWFFFPVFHALHTGTLSSDRSKCRGSGSVLQ